jgi:hypothetical protein
MRFEPARLIGAGLLVLVGILALAATELAIVTLIAAGRSTIGVGIAPLGWICLVLGAGMSYSSIGDLGFGLAKSDNTPEKRFAQLMTPNPPLEPRRGLALNDSHSCQRHSGITLARLR